MKRNLMILVSLVALVIAWFSGMRLQDAAGYEGKDTGMWLLATGVVALLFMMLVVWCWPRRDRGYGTVLACGLAIISTVTAYAANRPFMAWSSYETVVATGAHTTVTYADGHASVPQRWYGDALEVGQVMNFEVQHWQRGSLFGKWSYWTDAVPLN